MQTTRVVNISKKDYDLLKKYCDSKALRLSKWLVLIAKEHINTENKKQNIKSKEEN